jgi:hypothetical protein
MHTKLTLRLGEDLILQAKRHARKSGKSLSQMVADYFRAMKERFKGSAEERPLTPLVSKLKGSLRGSKISLKDYRRHLEEKYL